MCRDAWAWLAWSYVVLYHFKWDMLVILNIFAIVDLHINGMCVVFG